VLESAEFETVLRSEFGISVSEARLSRLWSLACAQHEAFASRPPALP
jgi:hypothetical protein